MNPSHIFARDHPLAIFMPDVYKRQAAGVGACIFDVLQYGALRLCG